jgi:hypothetical protein
MTVLLVTYCLYAVIKTHNFFKKERLVGDTIQRTENAACQENLLACQFGHACYRFGGPNLETWYDSFRRVISPSQMVLYLRRTTRHRTRRINIHAVSGIRTEDHSVQEIKVYASDRASTGTGNWIDQQWIFRADVTKLNFDRYIAAKFCRVEWDGQMVMGAAVFLKPYTSHSHTHQAFRCFRRQLLHDSNATLWLVRSLS